MDPDERLRELVCYLLVVNIEFLTHDEMVYFVFFCEKEIKKKAPELKNTERRAFNASRSGA